MVVMFKRLAASLSAAALLASPAAASARPAPARHVTKSHAAHSSSCLARAARLRSHRKHAAHVTRCVAPHSAHRSTVAHRSASAVLPAARITAAATSSASASSPSSSAASAGSAPATGPAAGQGLTWGADANTGGWGDKMGAVQQQVTQIGVRWIREQINWPTVEPAPGQWDWTSTDQLFASAAQHGLTVLPLLMLSPSWTGSARTQIPSDPTGYAQFVSQMVARYGPHGSFWAAHPELPRDVSTWFELWNEPYDSAFNNGDINAGRYAQLVKAAGAAGHAADPSAKFLLEATAQWDNGGHWGSWIGSMYAAVPDLNSYFDGVAVHPYGRSFTDTTATNGFYQDMNLVRADLVAHGAADKPFWLTEVGYSTCAGGSSNDCYSEAEQAQQYNTLIGLMKTTYASYVRAVFVYEFFDEAPVAADPTNRETHFGLTRQDGSVKPAWALVQSAAATA